MAPPMADVLRATSINETVVVSDNEESGDTKCGTFVELVIFHNAEKKLVIVTPVTGLSSLVGGATQFFFVIEDEMNTLDAIQCSYKVITY